MIDLRIEEADWLLTVDGRRRIIRDSAIDVEAGLIAAVGKSAEIRARGPAANTIAARGMVVTPGLIDSHIHTTFQMSRGLADEVGSRKFLFERMYPYEGALDEDDARVSIELCVLELIRNGVTSDRRRQLSAADHRRGRRARRDAMRGRALELRRYAIRDGRAACGVYRNY